mmetsp:Transcript_26412/g.36868  ORF Transcript_26412/g.36868 Transcript_26412/m.36868 type:complete len:130 (+) Transcript_26412:1062-1451(+)
MYQIGVGVSERHVGERLGRLSSHGIQDQKTGRIAYVAAEAGVVEEEVEEVISRGAKTPATITEVLIIAKILGVEERESVEAQEEGVGTAAEGEAAVAGKAPATIETNIPKPLLHMCYVTVLNVMLIWTL